MLNLYKKKGETPLERLNRLRIEKPIYKDATLSYAGRLDPMAEGVLLVMESDENKQREKYLGLDKTYEVEILLGVSTDTYDALGLVCGVYEGLFPKEDFVRKEIESRIGKFVQKYPSYSSKTVAGTPLWESSRKGEVVDTPEREVTLYKVNYESTKTIGKDELLQRVLSEVDSVKGDFRQKDIKDGWERALVASARKDFRVIKITLDVSSGFYVRVFADSLGKQLGVGASALSIKRTRAGEFRIGDSI